MGSSHSHLSEHAVLPRAATSASLPVASSSSTITTLLSTTTPRATITSTTTAAAAAPSCSSAELRTYSQNGSIYSVCVNSDYVGASVKVVANIQDYTGCAQQCQVNTGCQFAVFDKSTRNCHIKGAANTLTFGQSTRYTTLRYVGVVKNGDVLTGCPSGWSVVMTSLTRANQSQRQPSTPMTIRLGRSAQRPIGAAIS